MKLMFLTMDKWPREYVALSYAIMEAGLNEAQVTELFSNAPDIDGYYPMIEADTDAERYYLSVLVPYMKPNQYYTDNY